MIDLNKFRENQYSQHGEDGILACLFEKLGIATGTFCEFGAWDGKHLSNTFSLYKRGWQGVYIEGDKGRFEDLKENVKDPRVDLICAFVQPTGERSLGALLDQSEIVKKAGALDLLSIDIDSDDLAVFAGLEKYRALVVVIEYNSTIPLDTEFINPRGENIGNSARSIVKAAAQKSYSLVAATATNLIFVDSDRLPRDIKVFSLEDVEIFTQSRYFFGFDGTMIHHVRTVRGLETHRDELLSIPWKKAFFQQPVPKPFRKYEQGNVMNAVLFVYCIVCLIVSRPITSIREIHRRLSGS